MKISGHGQSVTRPQERLYWQRRQAIVEERRKELEKGNEPSRQ
ncbi:hypothetical protein PC116_g12249 [Phytophthora cactorum]|nr:hypothetical protein PC116_g12249 [Phytophthora cactorum]